MLQKILNQRLRELAFSKNCCQKFRNEWNEDKDENELIDMFYRGLDFFLITRFVSLEQIKEWLPEEVRHKNNIAIDEKRSFLNPEQGIVLGNSVVTVRANDHNVCNVYAVDDSHINIIVRHNAHLSITLCDNAQIDSISCDNSAHLYICKAGENTYIKPQIPMGNITIKEKFNLYTKHD